MMISIRLHIILCIVFTYIGRDACSQITSGKIVYERKTNLYKKFKDDENFKEWIREEEKTKIDYFELYFNDSLSWFQPQESNLKEQMSWTTRKNSTFEDFSKNYRFNIKKIWGEELFVEDSLIKRQWKITDSKRVIGGYSCRKAIWQVNDSTRIYAWYADDIIPSVGPESFYGLPGAIMGLASEDGGIIYFAKSVEAGKPDVQSMMPKKGRNKIYNTDELKTKLTKDFGKNPWGKAMIKDVFGEWQ